MHADFKDTFLCVKMNKKQQVSTLQTCCGFSNSDCGGGHALVEVGEQQQQHRERHRHAVGRRKRHVTDDKQQVSRLHTLAVGGGSRCSLYSNNQFTNYRTMLTDLHELRDFTTVQFHCLLLLVWAAPWTHVGRV